VTTPSANGTAIANVAGFVEFEVIEQKGHFSASQGGSV